MKVKTISSFIFLLLTACNTISFPDLSGDYAGSWLLDSQTVAVTAIVSKPIDNHEVVFSDIELTSLADQTKKTLRIQNSKQQEGNISLLFLNTHEPAIDLKLHGTCADGKRSQDNKEVEIIELCWTVNNITLIKKNAKGRVLSGLSLRKNDGLPDYGDPGRAITISYSQALQRAKSSTYNEAQKAEKLYRARNNIKIARSNLLPHFSGRSIISMILFPATGFGLIDTIGNLLPFIFPSNWYKVEQAQYLAEAEKLSYDSLIANEVSMTESLYYTIARDQALLQETKIFIHKANAIIESAKQLQMLGILEPEIVLEMQNILRDHEQDAANLQFLIREELIQFAGALAISPVTSVVKVENLEIPDLSKEVFLVEEKVLTSAKLKSLEMATLQSIIRASGSELKSINYSVINPSDFVSIDFSMSARTSNVISSIRELQFQIDAVLGAVEENTVSLVNRYNLILQSDKKLQEEWISKKTDLIDLYKRAEVQAISPRQFFYSERTLFEVKFRSLENAHQFFIARGKIQRLMLNGAYEQADASKKNLKMP